MRTFFLTIAFVSLAVAISSFIPRTLVSELRWEVVWEHRLASSGSVFVTDGTEINGDDRLVATTASEFLVIGASDGSLSRLGLRASQFTASDSFFYQSAA